MYTKAAPTPQEKSGPSARRTQDDGEVTGFGHGAPAGHKDDDRWDKGRRGLKGHTDWLTDRKRGEGP